MSTFLAFDPGLRTSGWALFRETSGVYILEAAGLSRSTKSDIGDVCCDHDAQVPVATSFIGEQMQIYNITMSKVDPEDLALLLILTGYIARSRTVGTPPKFVTPKAWKGQRPKDTIKPLVKHYLQPGELMIMERLEAETRAKKVLHNAWEAVGIGLCGLGRWAR